MKKIIILGCLFISFLGFAGDNDFELNTINFSLSKIRTGIFRTDKAEVKGTILYLEGLGDSMLNHAPLFSRLVESGYDVIAFDYMGQGGSSGYMHFSSIQNIGKLAKKVWNYYIKDSSKKMILLGWSTGGLVAYSYAYLKPSEVDSVILLAPGIAPKVWVGERMRITLASLTQNRFLGAKDPHIDEIRPNSPLKAPGFATNLLSTAMLARTWKMPKSVKGLVLLSSREDTYVDSPKTIKVLDKNASHFKYFMYEGTGALHELDNELEYISRDVQRRIIEFLD